MYPLILSHLNETNMHSPYSMDKLTFGISLHITVVIKLINPFTDNRHNRLTNITNISSTTHRLCGHHQWQCATCSTVDVLRACSLM